ncbi:hypothetical protein CsSME_00027529 [Camellia sinensis var. sinensis]
MLSSTSSGFKANELGHNLGDGLGLPLFGPISLHAGKEMVATVTWIFKSLCTSPSTRIEWVSSPTKEDGSPANHGNRSSERLVHPTEGLGIVGMEMGPSQMAATSSIERGVMGSSGR